MTGINVTSTNTLVEFSAAQATALANANIKVTTPTNDTVAVADTASNLQGLDPRVIADLPNLSATLLIVNDDVRPIFDLAQEDAIAKGSLTVNDPVGVTQLTLAQLPGYDFIQGSTYTILDAGILIDNVSAGTIAALPASVTLLESSGGSVVLNVAQALALENAALQIAVPSGNSVSVVDTAAALEALSPAELTALGFIGVTSVAASDQAPVFSPEQLAGLNAGSVNTVAPPNDPLQNVGTTVISGPEGPGKGLTFDILWGPSVASAPAGYEAILEQAFQYYADTFSNPVTLYYTIGFNRINAGGANQPQNTTESYSALVAQMQANAQSKAQQEAVASLPASSPIAGADVTIPVAEAQALGFTNLNGAGSSFANAADLNLDADNGVYYLYSTNPDQVPNNNGASLISVMEHEISEGMGRVSNLDNAGNSYGPVDLFRFSGPDPNNSDPGNLALSPFSNPSYFSIDDGVTDLADWNNHLTGTQGDLDDWAASAGNNSYTEYPSGDTVEPVTATDVTLMNVLGYNLATPTETPTLPPLLNVMFFDGNDANGNSALWVSGGSAATTQELVGVNGIAGDTVSASGITTFGNNILFNGADLHGNDGLWISNGAAWGTQQITGIADAASAAQGGLDPTDLTVVGNDVWFEGKDASGNVGLWDTDGTAAGTKELIPGFVGSDMTLYDGAVYFVGTDGGLWKTDGTAAGTTEIVGQPATALGQFSNEPNAPPGGATYNIYTPGAPFPGGFGAGSLDVFNGQLLFGGTVIEENQTQTPVWQRLLFSWNGSTVQSLGIGPFEDGIANGVNSQGQPVAYFNSSPGGPGVGSLTTSSSTSNDLLLYGVPNNNYTLINGLGTAGSPLSHSSTWKDVIVQTDGTAAGTAISPYNSDGSVVADPTPFDGGLLFEGNLDGVNVSSNGQLQIESPGFDLLLGTSNAPQSSVQLTEQLANSTDHFNNEADTTDLVNGIYNPAIFPEENPEPALSSSAIYPDAQSIVTGSGFDPHDITVFDGEAYFSAVNAEGQDQLWLLNPTGEYGGGSPFWSIGTFVNTFGLAGEYLNATGEELNGIAGASAAGLDPSNITGLTIPRTVTLVPITEGQLLVDETLDRINPGSATAPAGEGFVLTDTALDIESLTAAEITAGIAIGLDAIASTDTSVVFTVDMVEALEPSTYVMAPTGDTVTIADYAASIEGMSDAQLSELTEVGVSAIVSTDASVVLGLAQALALTTPVIVTATADVAITAPLGDTVSATGTAAQIEALSSAQIIALKSVGISALTATDASVELTVAQAVALEDPIPVTVPSGDTVTISDTATNIAALTAGEIAALPGIGVTAIAATDGPLVLQPGQANAMVAAGLHVSVPSFDNIIVADTATDVIAMTTAQIDTYASLGVTEIATSSGVTLSVAQVDELEKDGISLIQGTGTHLSVTVLDTPAQIETLTSDDISGLPSLSPNFNNEVFSTDYQVPNSTITLNAGQFIAYEQNSIDVITPVLAIEDAPGGIETLTPSEIAALGNASPDPVSVTVDSPWVVRFTLGEALAIVGTNYSQSGTSALKLSGSAGHGLSIIIGDTAANFEALTTAQIDALGHFDLALGPNAVLDEIGLASSLVLNVAQAAAAAADNVVFTVAPIDVNTGQPTGFTVSIGDTAANITGLLDLGASEVAQVIGDLGISGIAATDGSVALSVGEAEALETADANLGTHVAVSAPAGDAVTLADTAADIEAMTPAQLGALTSIGVTAVDVTDQSITLTVAQALALYDPVPISVPPGDTVIVADTEAEIESLTPTEVAGLAAIGVKEIDVSNLTGAGPLTIDGGITLAISGAVPSNETITFAGTGGTLSLNDDVAGTDAAGTIFGFSPPDTIDLTDVPYDATGISEGVSGAVLGTDPTDSNQAIIVTENGNTYDLDIDPSQIFLTTPTFELNPDSTGNGTALTVVESTVTNESFQVLAGETSDGIVIGSGGEVEGESSATVNRAVVQSGGELLGDVGSTISDTFIQSGGLVDLNSGASGSGIINFSPPVGEPPVGGTLQIDDLFLPTFTIDGFANGDTIDLTALTYDPDGSVNLVSGNVLDVNEDSTTYTLQLDQRQNFNGDYFHLTPDSAGTGTDITENTTPCYCRGTRIQTRRGQKRVENLKIGDRVMTKAGVTRPIKWIGRRSYGGRFIMGQKEILPICIRAGALDDNVPRRDLWISPHHAMFFKDEYLGGVLIEAKDLINGVSIVQAERVESVEYFHIELDSHDVLIAEGALSESFIDDNSRGMFHNAHEYRSLYSDAAAGAAQYCAPRFDHGYEVEAACRRIALRAGLLRAADGPRIGPLRGYVDAVGPRRIEGWAQHVDHPEAPVCLDIYADGRMIGQTLANMYRDDLQRAGLGSGCHGFSFVPPPGLAFAGAAVEVRRSLDGAILMRSGKTNIAWHERTAA